MKPETLLPQNKLDFARAMLSTTRDIPGDIIEVGVYKGGALWHFANDAKDWGKCIIGYDTFEGLPAPTESDRGGAHREHDFSETTFKEVSQALENCGVKVELVKGLYPLSANHDEVSFCHLDVDLYGSTYAALLYLETRMPQGACVVVDDFQWHHTPGVELAVHEFLEHTRFFIPEARSQYSIALRRIDL